MGETYDQVQKEIARVPYSVVRGDNNTPRVDIDGRLYTPQEISAMILQKMKKKEWKRVLFVPTGALLSTVSFNEGNSIPGIAHAVMLEGISGSGKGVGEWTM